MRQRHYFTTSADAPPPLKRSILRVVRFDELDPLNIVWHGNYASYFEEARVALGNFYGIGYLDFFNRGVSIPLKKFHADFCHPLEFGKEYRVEALLHWNEAARLDFEFGIYNTNNVLMSRGYSVHLLIDKSQGVLVMKPDFFAAFCERWKRGEII